MQVSVVIPTYNRAERLARLLQCLVAQTDGAAMEVLVCDDGSDDATPQVAAAAARQFDVRYLRQPRRGFRPGQARNLGIDAARGRIVVFMDDDTLPAPDFIAGHLRAHQRAARPAVAIGFYFRVIGPCAPPTQRADIVRHRPDVRFAELGLYGERMHTVRRPWRLLHSCNFSAPRGAAELRFAESFEGWGCEDNELGYRLLRSGLKLVVAANAPVLHVDDPASFDPFLAEVRGDEGDYTSYAANLLRMLALHGADPDMAAFVDEQLSDLWVDPGDRRWRRPQLPRLRHLGATLAALRRSGRAAGAPVARLGARRVLRHFAGPRLFDRLQRLVPPV